MARWSQLKLTALASGISLPLTFFPPAYARARVLSARYSDRRLNRIAGVEAGGGPSRTGYIGIGRIVKKRNTFIAANPAVRSVVNTGCDVEMAGHKERANNHA